MKKVGLFLVTFSLILLIGCQSSNDLQRFDTKDKAIEYGLEKEGVNNTALLSVEDFEGEQFVFYERESALGVANIIESDEGFRWSRNNHYHGFEGDAPYVTVDFNAKTNTGKDVLILAGRVFDSSIQTMKIIDNGMERELKIYGESRFFYLIHSSSFQSLKITPIRE